MFECVHERKKEKGCEWRRGSSVSAVVAQVSQRTVQRRGEARERERGGESERRGSLKCDSQSQGGAQIIFSTAARRNCSEL